MSGEGIVLFQKKWKLPCVGGGAEFDPPEITASINEALQPALSQPKISQNQWILEHGHQWVASGVTVDIGNRDLENRITITAHNEPESSQTSSDSSVPLSTVNDRYEHSKAKKTLFKPFRFNQLPTELREDILLQLILNNFDDGTFVIKGQSHGHVLMTRFFRSASMLMDVQGCLPNDLEWSFQRLLFIVKSKESQSPRLPETTVRSWPRLIESPEIINHKRVSEYMAGMSYLLEWLLNEVKRSNGERNRSILERRNRGLPGQISVGEILRSVKSGKSSSGS